MPFQPGQSGNPAGRKKQQQTLSSVQRDVRRSSIRIIGERASELVDLGVRRALAGNDVALAGCLQILASMVGEQPTSQPSTSPADITNSQRPVVAD